MLPSVIAQAVLPESRTILVATLPITIRFRAAPVPAPMIRRNTGLNSDMTEHKLDAPSPWVQRFSPLVAHGARVLDVACGSGRHARWFAGRGCSVEAVDRDEEALAGLREVADVTVRIADLENAAWPFAQGEFDAIVVTNYLHRPLFRNFFASINETGVLIYETFMDISQAAYS
jgi:SAM-dependent methyltransferase